MMKTMFGGLDDLCANISLVPDATASVPSAALRNKLRRLMWVVRGIGLFPPLSVAKLRPLKRYTADP